MVRIFGKYIVYLTEEELEILNKNRAFASENPSVYIQIKKIVPKESRQFDQKEKSKKN